MFFVIKVTWRRQRPMTIVLMLFLYLAYFASLFETCDDMEIPRASVK